MKHALYKILVCALSLPYYVYTGKLGMWAGLGDFKGYTVAETN